MIVERIDSGGLNVDDICDGDRGILDMIEADEIMGELERWERDNPEE